jgi:hypothetical protein
MEVDKIHAAAKQGTTLGRASFKISLGGRVLMVKYQPKCGSLLSRFTRRLVGGSLPYLNEPRVNALLQSNTFDDFSFPRLISNHLPSCCVYEFVADARKLNGRIPDDKSDLTTAILELHAVRDRIRKPLLEKALFSLLERPVYRTLKMAAFSECSTQAKIKILLMAVKYSLIQKKLPGVLLHNDLNWSNIIFNKQGKPVLVDFEDAIFERKWVLSDLVDLLFDFETASLDTAQLEDAWRQLACRLKIQPGALKFKQQVRLCLIKSVLAALSSGLELPCDRRVMGSFLKTLLNNTRYNSWFRNNRGQSQNRPVCAVRSAVGT